MNTEQRVQRDALLGPQDVATAGAVTSAVYYDMAGFRGGAAVCMATLTEAKTALCRLMQATAEDGTDEKEVSGDDFAVTLTGGTGGSEEIDAVEFKVQDLDLINDFRFVGVKITTNQDGDDVSASLERHDSRYLPLD